RGGLGRFLWIFVLLAIVLAWWYFRSGEDRFGTDAMEAEDRTAAVTDPDDILVDLVDNATPAQIAAIEHDLDIKLELVDDVEAPQTGLYRAHVDAARRDAVIEQLAKRPEVEIAEPDAEATLSPGEAMEVLPGEPTDPGYPNDPLYNKQWNMR